MGKKEKSRLRKLRPSQGQVMALAMRLGLIGSKTTGAIKYTVVAKHVAQREVTQLEAYGILHDAIQAQRITVPAATA